MFPKKGEVFDEATIKDLLSDDEKGARVGMIKLTLLRRAVTDPFALQSMHPPVESTDTPATLSIRPPTILQ